MLLYHPDMTNSDKITSFQRKLLDLAESEAGFAASDITGYSPETVRRTAEVLVKAGSIVRFKVSARRVRYFACDELGKKYMACQVSASALSNRGTAGSRVRATWSADEPGRITAKTKIYIAPPLPRNVYKTYTYPQF